MSLSALVILMDIIIAQDYFIVSNDESGVSFNWEEANSLCDTSNPRGQLASSHNNSHDNIMHNLCQSTGSDSCWIGLYRESNQQEWEWMDNSEFSHRFTSNLNAMPTTEEQSCISLITSSEEPAWSYGDCLESLSSAICSTCGELNQYCCSVGDGCNGDDMECIDNQCVANIIMENTEYFTSTEEAFPDPTTTSYKFTGTTDRSGLHLDHPSTVAIACVIVLVILFNIFCCFLKKRKLRMIEEFETNRMNEPHHTFTPITSNEAEFKGEHNNGHAKDVKVRMDVTTDEHETEEEEQKYYED